MWAPFFWVGGAQGFTSGLANVHPPLAFEMFDALKAGDTAKAMKVWARIKPFEDLRARGNNANNVPVVKEALAQLGECERRVRPPISDLSESERAQVTAILADWGLLRGAGESP
jgi:4-hydroxy-tetrahydrodipicolinate synthase